MCICSQVTDIKTDVGGGAVKNSEVNHLARIPLRWMIRECFNCDTGILFDARMLQKAGLPVVDTRVHPDHKRPIAVLQPLYIWKPDDERPEDIFKKRQPERWRAYSKRHVVGDLLTMPLSYIFLSFGKKDSDTSNRHNGIAEHQPFKLEDKVDEYVEDLNDIICAQHDRLTEDAFWLFMEMIPLHLQKHKAMKADGKVTSNATTKVGCPPIS